MDYARLGSSDLVVSRIGFGGMSIGEPSLGRHAWIKDGGEARSLLRAALDAGINFFDTADVYAEGTSERLIGGFLHDERMRDCVVLATKVGGSAMSQAPAGGRLSRGNIVSAVERSLVNLRTDRIDLLQVHRWDYQTPIEETLEALAGLVRTGKVRHVGFCSVWAWQLMTALALQERHNAPRMVSMQAQYNLIYREDERELLPACRDRNVAIIAYSPLARGILARRPGGETARARLDPGIEELFEGAAGDPVLVELDRLAAAAGASPARLALAWVLTRPDLAAALVGVSSPQQIEDATAALELRIDPHAWAPLERAYAERPLRGHV